MLVRVSAQTAQAEYFEMSLDMSDIVETQHWWIGCRYRVWSGRVR